MKKFYSLLAVTIILTVNLFGKSNLWLTANSEQTFNLPTKMTKEMLLALPDNDIKSKDLLPLLQGKYKIVDRTIDVYFNSMFQATTPIAYEPISNTIFMIQTNRLLAPPDTSKLTGYIYLYWSTDMGATWSRETVYERLGDVPVNASIAVTNPKGSTNPQECFPVIYSRYFRYDNFSSSYLMQGGLFLYPNGGGLNKSGFDEYPETGPLSNNPGYGQWWSMSKMLSYTKPNDSYAYIYGTLNPQQGQRYGYYGFGNIHITNNGVEGNNSTMPLAWDYTNWRLSDDPLRSYNGPMNIDVDADGNLYACVFNYFSDYNDDYDRRPAISKSTDNGITWSNWDRVPLSLINKYKSDRGVLIFQPNYYIFPNGSPASYGFAATGKDEYTFIFTAALAIKSNQEYDEVRLIEVFKKNGEWNIRDIHTANNFLAPYIMEDTTGNSNAEIVDRFDLNPRGWEIQLAKTADNNNLLLKFVDQREDLAPLIEGFNLVGGGLVDTIPVSDVYVSYRDAANTTGWAPIKNVTDDYWNNKVTWIPQVIPSLTEVPIIEHVTVRFNNPQNPRFINKYPYVIQNYIIDPGVRNEIVFATFDATNPNKIGDEVLMKPEGVIGYPVSVEEQININVNTFSIYPNPANNVVELLYELDKSANVKIEIFNNLGQLVKTVKNYMPTEPGTKAINVNVNDLSTGVYYVTITANGKKLTKMLNVTR